MTFILAAQACNCRAEAWMAQVPATVGPSKREAGNILGMVEILPTRRI
jgi:hypothetical protein